MKINDFPSYATQNPDLDGFFLKFEEWTNQLLANPFLVGIKLENVELSTTPKSLYHGLSKEGQRIAYSGFLVLNQNAGASIYSTADEATAKDNITLTATATVTADIWVF